MSGNCCSQNELFERILKFIVAAESNDLTEDYWTSFERLLRESDDACRLYAKYMDMSTLLPSVLESAGEFPPPDDFSFFSKQQDPIAPSIPTFLSNTIHDPVGYYSYSGWAVAYLIATVIFGIGAIIGSITYVSQPVQVAQERELPVVIKDYAASKPQTEHVGRITGMVDCKWTDSSTRPVSGRVARGQKYALSSGLMEIAYDTGAKVILQGPVTYEVDSKDGGYLAVGKLTARVEKKAEGGGRKAEDRNLPSPSGRGAGGEGRRTRDSSAQTQTALTLALSRKERGPDSISSLSTIHYPLSTASSPLFTIKTPTATVTDLGTEFGVEVTKEGNTSSHVFRGVVEVQLAAEDGKGSGRTVRLSENESVWVGKQQGGAKITVQRGTADGAAFIRSEQLPKVAAKLAKEQRLKAFHRWQAHSQELRRDPSLLAYYDFQQKPGEPAVLPNVAGNGARSLDGVVENAAWVDGRMAGKHALLFNGPGDYVQINLPQKVDDLTLAAWVYVDTLDNSLNGLVMSDRWERDGQIHWQLDSDGRMVLAVFMSGATGSEGSYHAAPLADHARISRWTHLATVYDRAAECVQFYVDGKVMGRFASEAIIGRHSAICIGPARVGTWSPSKESGGTAGRNFHGRMDELAIFGRPLTADEIQRMFEAGKPANLEQHRGQ